MVNLNKLRGRMAERQITVKGLAEQLSVSAASLYRRFNAPEEITVGEATKMKDILGLSVDEASQIFFAE